MRLPSRLARLAIRIDSFVDLLDGVLTQVSLQALAEVLPIFGFCLFPSGRAAATTRPSSWATFAALATRNEGHELPALSTAIFEMPGEQAVPLGLSGCSQRRETSGYRRGLAAASRGTQRSSVATVECRRLWLQRPPRRVDDDARRRAMGVELAVAIGDPAFRGGGAPADVDHRRFAA